MVRNFTTKVDYSENFITTVAINVNDFSSGTKSIFGEFLYYCVSAVKLTLIPLNSRCIGNRIATDDGSTTGTTDVNLPVVARFTSSEVAKNALDVINDPRSRTYSYGRTLNFYNKIRTPLVVAAQGSASANVDLFPRKSVWLSTSDVNFKHGTYLFATPNWSASASEIPQDLSYSVHIRLYVMFKQRRT